MPKANHKKKPEAEIAPSAGFKPKFLYNMYKWVYRPIPEGMAIEAYVEAAGDWQIVAEIKQTAFLDAETTANYIVKAINNSEPRQKLIGDMIAALEMCLKCKGITWEAEQEAEVVIKRAKELLP